MRKFELTCCSTADMNADFFAGHDIRFACFHFIMNGKEYDDDLGKSMSFDSFYKAMDDGAQPTTSQVNTAQYIALWEPLLKDGKDVLHLTLSSGISGAYNSACAAREILETRYPDRRLFVVDSLGASSGYGMLVDAVCALRDAGENIDEVCSWVEDNKLKLHHWFFSTDLSSYYRGGRISKASQVIGTVLRICPLLNMNDEGKLIPRTKIRGKKAVVKAIVEAMEEHAQGGTDYAGKCFISNSACPELAEAVAELVKERFKNLNGKVVINSVGTTIGCHTGSGTVALFFWGDRRVR